MNTKLTLRLDDAVIDKAKRYSKRKKTSLSALVEKFFRSLEEPNSEIIYDQQTLSPLVKELSGIYDFDYNYNIKKQKEIRLIKKYL
jgi:hypothetical protein